MGILSNVQSNKLRFHSSRIDIEFQSYRNVHLNEEVLCSSFLFTFALWKMFKNFVSNRKFSLYRYIYVLLCDILCSVWAFYKTRSEEIKNWTHRIHWTHSAFDFVLPKRCLSYETEYKMCMHICLFPFNYIIGVCHWDAWDIVTNLLMRANLLKLGLVTFDACMPRASATMTGTIYNFYSPE